MRVRTLGSAVPIEKLDVSAFTIPTGTAEADQYVKKYKDELLKMRTISLGKVMGQNKNDKGKATGSATDPSGDFLLLVSTSGPFDDAKWVRGSDDLKNLSTQVRTANSNMAFPDGTPTRILRRGTMQCSEQSGECNLVLLDADTVNAVD